MSIVFFKHDLVGHTVTNSAPFLGGRLSQFVTGVPMTEQAHARIGRQDSLEASFGLFRAIRHYDLTGME
jgi:hypothetical protein